MTSTICEYFCILAIYFWISSHVHLQTNCEDFLCSATLSLLSRFYLAVREEQQLRSLVDEMDTAAVDLLLARTRSKFEAECQPGEQSVTMSGNISFYHTPTSQ